MFPKPISLFKTDDVIWSFDFINDSEFLITERSGKLIHFNKKTSKKTNLNVPKVSASGQGGLLDVHLKKINNTNYIYITFSQKHLGSLTTVLARAKFSGPKQLDWEVLFRAKVKSNSSVHFGSRIVFVDNHLFMTIGDRGKRKLAQDLSLHQGKILRLTLNGKAPKDNPFINIKNAQPEIWSYGHRNPQGIIYDNQSKTLYSTEFGPRGGDELNIIKKGKNYGWPLISYGSEYWGPKIGKIKMDGMEQPITYWVPSISPSGLAFYNNSLYIANLSSEHIRKVNIKNKVVTGQSKLFESLEQRIRHVKISKDKKLYFSTDEGHLYRAEL